MPGRVVRRVGLEFPLPFRVHDRSDVINNASLDWMVRPWLARRSITVLSGPSLTAGKTTFLLHMIAALRSGGRFLGAEALPSEVALLTDMEPHLFSDAAFQSGLTKPEVLDGLEVLYDEEVPVCSLKRLMYAVEAHCRGVIDTVMVDSGRLLLARAAQQSDRRREVARWLRWLARSGLAVLITVPTPHRMEIDSVLEHLGPLADEADTVMHLQRTAHEQPTFFGRPDLFEGERILKAQRRRLTAESNLGCVPSRTLIRLGPEGYSYMYTQPERRQEDVAQLPGTQLSLAHQAG
jgi:hypothetical protein